MNLFSLNITPNFYTKKRINIITNITLYKETTRKFGFSHVLTKNVNFSITFIIDIFQ